MSHDRAPSLVLCELADPGIEGLLSHSPFCLKAHHALRVAGLAYERRHGRAPRDFAKDNPAGQVPVLLVDGKPVCDSTRILAWIDETTGALSRGLDARQRAEAWLWEDYADTALNGFVVAARWADERNWPGVREAYFGAAPWPVRALIVPRMRSTVIGGLRMRDVWRTGPEACWERFERTLDHLDARAPKSGLWVGPSVSVADVSLLGQLHCLRNHLTAWQAQAIAARPALSAYLDRAVAATLAGGAVKASAPKVNGVAAIAAA